MPLEDAREGGSRWSPDRGGEGRQEAPFCSFMAGGSEEMMDIELRGTLLMAFAGLLVVGCSPTEAGPGTIAPADPATTVEVFNNNWMDINVYAVRAGARIRLGTVESMSRQTFRLPASTITTAGMIRLLADPIGSRRSHVTDGIVVQQGDRISWNLENSLPLSHYTVRR